MGIFDFLKRDTRSRRAAIIDVDDGSFGHHVLRRSYVTTVIVDFWAAWCGPCLRLGPILEKIAEDPDSEFILAKLNTEHNQKTARKYNILSIPNVKAFRNGQVVHEFTGALPEVLVRRFTEKASKMAPPPAQMKGPADPEKRLALARQHLAKGRSFDAYVLLDNFPEGPKSDEARTLLPLARFLFDISDGLGLSGSEELDRHYMLAAEQFSRRDAGRALEHLAKAREIEDPTGKHKTEAIMSAIRLLQGMDGS